MRFPRLSASGSSTWTRFKGKPKAADRRKCESANYGASPGDADHAQPYLYVGPWTVTEDPFWQGAAYATLGIAELAGATDPDSVALDFFARGYAAATRP